MILKSTQKLFLNFISTIVNNEAAVMKMCRLLQTKMLCAAKYFVYIQ